MWISSSVAADDNPWWDDQTEYDWTVPVSAAGAEDESSGPSSVPDIDQLSDSELLDLYITRRQETLLRQTVDDTSLVAAGTVILQAGYGWSRDQDELDFEYDTHVWPQLLLRYRLNDTVEFRVGWSGWIEETLTDQLTQESDMTASVADPSLGLRFALCSQDGLKPRLSLTLATPVDVQNDLDLTHRFNPLGTISYSWLFQEHWLFSGASGLSWISNGEDRFLDFQQSLSVDYLINDHWDVLVEWYARFPGESAGSTEHYAGPGVVWTVNDRWQLGVTTSWGLNEAATDVQAQCQVTWRL